MRMVFPGVALVGQVMGEGFQLVRVDEGFMVVDFNFPLVGVGGARMIVVKREEEEIKPQDPRQQSIEGAFDHLKFTLKLFP